MTRLLGAAEALREEMGKPLRLRERGEYDQLLSSARAALGEEAAAAAWEAGRAMSLQQAVEYALYEAAGVERSLGFRPMR